MTPEQFDVLLNLIYHKIAPSSRCVRQPVPAKDRLSIVLRYLASGDSMMSLSYFSGVSQPCISKFVVLVCNAIWEVLSPIVMPMPTSETWERVAIEMDDKWQFPNCVGAVDGKHVVMQAPAKAGSTYFNYKGSHSIVLLAVCDANYRFLVVDIGGSGRNSDGGIFQNSEFGQALNDGELHLPPPSCVYGIEDPMPYTFVGDEAFPLKVNLMRPYPGRGLTYGKRVFNYRLSRCRRLIENTFGIMTARFRIFRSPINSKVQTVEAIVKATVCLHNFLKAHDDQLLDSRKYYCPVGYADSEEEGIVTPGRWRNRTNHALRDLRRVPTTHSREAGQVRDLWQFFFLYPGSVFWQRESVTSSS